MTLLEQCLDRYEVSATFAGDYIKQNNLDEPYVYQWGGKLGTLTIEQASEYAYGAPPGSSWMNGNGIYLPSPLQLYPLPSADSIAAAQLNAALLGPSEAIVVTEGVEDQMLQDSFMPRDSTGRIPNEGGCFGEIEEKLDAPLIDTRDLEADAYGLTFEHAAVVKKAQEWSVCMQQAGFRYETFSDAATANPGRATPEKIAAAKADVACTTSSQWPSTFYPILSDYEQQIIDRQPDIFQDALAAERRRLERIDLLIDG